jgi:hypothetical protein
MLNLLHRNSLKLKPASLKHTVLAKLMPSNKHIFMPLSLVKIYGSIRIEIQGGSVTTNHPKTSNKVLNAFGL